MEEILLLCVIVSICSLVDFREHFLSACLLKHWVLARIFSAIVHLGASFTARDCETCLSAAALIL
jgi:hypothetical protein